VFYKNAKGEIFHTYGAFGRGDEQCEEYGPTHSLPDWAEVHDRYGSNGNDETACGCATR
jgi:predicted dithiol-disulfide oxidoreductase (DUF899 family)